MAVSYKKFFHLLIDQNKTPAQVAKDAGVSGNIITRMKRDEYVSMESVEKICFALNCKVDDMLDFDRK